MLKRTIFALAGAQVFATLVAAAEARSVASDVAGSHAPDVAQLFMSDLAVLAPLALMVAFGVAVVHLFIEPGVPRAPAAHLADARAEPMLARTRTAAVWPLAVVVGLLWTIGSAHLARAELAHGSPLASGLGVAVGAVGLLFVLVACALAALPYVRRALAAGAARHARLVDPVTTGGVALFVSLVVLACGVMGGDTGGDGAWPLGIFGVLRRRELDLRVAVNVVAIAMGAYLAPVALLSSRRRARALLAGALTIAPLVVTAAEARGLTPLAARAIERHAPLGKVALAALRAATDRDHDGASALFAGGDCDDHDKRRSPTALDVPGNGIDEDCSGADAPIPAPPPPPPPPPPPSSKIPDDLNLVLITVDTLRTDVGFMGYPKDTTPNLDRLAEKSVVFDRAYAMASYTGKSLAPMLIGKYPNETDRDGGHFNTYLPSNTLVAERLKKADIFTMGAASHWYFMPWSGLAQGIDAWDLSARPGEGQGDTDTSITSSELATAAIRLLSKNASTHKRFFMWLHFFDPHAQYMPHPGAPDFLGDARSPTAVAKASYDAEVWFTDKHVGRVLDHIASQPWGERTAIIVTADHGEAFADHGMNMHGYELWESLVHVPLLIHVPGLESHHVPIKRGHIDVAPTILDLMKVEPSDRSELRGVSLVPDLLAKDGDPLDERDVYFDMPAGPYNAMRRGLLHGKSPGMKLIHLGAAQYQLFDLAADPEEKDDLAQEKEKLDPVVEAFQSLRAGLKENDVKPASPEPQQ